MATIESTPLRRQPAYEALASHYDEIKEAHLRDLFAADPGRGTRLTAEAAGLYLDYSKNRVTDETLALLAELAEESGLRARIDAMFAGEQDQRHRGPRRPARRAAVPRGRSLHRRRRRRRRRRARGARPDGGVRRPRPLRASGTGHTGKPIANVVNIGIGGSDLGPVMAYEALRHYSKRDLTFRFVSNVDGTDFAEATRDLDPAQTLFIVSLEDVHDPRDDDERRRRRATWLLAALGGDESAVAKHFVAVSTNAEAVAAFGIDPMNMFGFWDWVGGRYSMDSAIGLSTMIAIGPERSASCSPASTRWTSTSAPRRSEQNLPVLLGLLDGLVRRLLRRADRGRAAVRPVPRSASRPTCSS